MYAYIPKYRNMAEGRQLWETKGKELTCLICVLFLTLLGISPREPLPRSLACSFPSFLLVPQVLQTPEHQEEKVTQT